MPRQKKVGKLRGNVGAIRILVKTILKEMEEVVNVGKVILWVNSSLCLSENPDHRSSKKEPFSLETHSKIPILSPMIEIVKLQTRL